MNPGAALARRDAVMRIVRASGEQALAMRKHATVVAGAPPSAVTTTADLAIEARLIEDLARIEASWPLVSEEADRGRWCERIRDLQRRRRSFWIVDPIDGTSSFIAGDDRFGVQVALVHDGRLAGGWISCPALGWEVCAHDEAPVWTAGLPSSVPTPSAPTSIHAVIASGDFADDHRDRVWRIARTLGSVRATRSCAVDYSELAAGRRDVLLYRRTLPWDHAPGVYLCRRLGAEIGTFGDGDYNVADGCSGLLVVSRRGRWLSRTEFLP